MIIKFLLLAALGAAAVKLVRGRRSALGVLVRRALMLGTIATGAAAVLFPARVTEVAKLVGVGRGTDLVVYVLCVAFLLVAISIYQRLNELHDRHVELVREHALLEARVLRLTREAELGSTR